MIILGGNHSMKSSKERAGMNKPEPVLTWRVYLRKQMKIILKGVSAYSLSSTMRDLEVVVCRVVQSKVN